MIPVIGVIPLYDEEKESIWMLPGYIEGIRAAGGLPIILPLHMTKLEFDEIKESIDGYLFTGGHDVSPKLYGEEDRGCCGVSNKDRDILESMIFRYAYENDKPVLGICRGIQFINAFMGGTLYQDLPTEYVCKQAVEHHMNPPYNRTVHGVTIVPGSPLEQIIHKKDIRVNSYHHQAIKTVSKSLEVMATAEDGLIEAVYVPDKNFIWGVQWHPEFIYQEDKDQFAIFGAFIQACM